MYLVKYSVNKRFKNIKIVKLKCKQACVGKEALKWQSENDAKFPLPYCLYLFAIRNFEQAYKNYSITSPQSEKAYKTLDFN